ncbi:TauD/TfdA family dioxygenase [Streptomyces sp. DT193]|uniref:TauD/TfdA family dioxygenase n=1 Tax=Streptomyces sp. DT193 TaxID=3393418 RepID=UPI003CEA0088
MHDRRQQMESNHVQHVRDVGVDPAGSTSRSYQHSGQLGYHADPNDVVALLCIRSAQSGGLSCIVSSVAVHNEIVRTRPDLATVLYELWWRDLGGGSVKVRGAPRFQGRDPGPG